MYYGMVWFGIVVVYYGMAWYGIVQYSLIEYLIV